MNLKNDVARLERIGEEHSAQMKKIRVAADRIGYWLDAIINLPKNAGKDPMAKLPRNYVFISYGRKGWKLYKVSVTRNEVDLVSWHPGARRDLLVLAEDIANGWLDEVANQFLHEIEELKRTERKTESFLAAMLP